MSCKRRTRATVMAAAGGLACILAWPGAARAQNTCNTFISFAYIAGQPFQEVGDTVRVALTIGAGAISGGTNVTINRLRFELDCDSGGVLGLNCTDDGAVVEYQGDGTITTTCPTAFTTGHPVSDLPNQVLFTATPAVVR